MIDYSNYNYLKTFDFKTLFEHICQIKEFVIKLSSKELKKYKIIFYNQNFLVWTLDRMWEFIWDDIDYEKMQTIFKNNRLI